MIEANTPYTHIKEGLSGIHAIRAIQAVWKGRIVTDLKTTASAVGAVDVGAHAGATAATVLGSMSPEVLTLFIRQCHAEMPLIARYWVLPQSLQALALATTSLKLEMMVTCR